MVLEIPIQAGQSRRRIAFTAGSVFTWLLGRFFSKFRIFTGKTVKAMSPSVPRSYFDPVEFKKTVELKPRQKARKGDRYRALATTQLNLAPGNRRRWPVDPLRSRRRTVRVCCEQNRREQLGKTDGAAADFRSRS